MYVPSFTAIDADDARSFVEQTASGWLVTNAADGPPAATLMPIIWTGDTVIAHMAKANRHWRTIADGTPGLIIGGPEAYVSPSWYATKREHGKVVPTWNYIAVHITGTVHVHRDSQWLLDAVTTLTDRHERPRSEPWHVTDAPSDYIASQLKAIVGIELRVDRVEGKAKLSQNRSAEDQAGVVHGLSQALDDPSAAAIADAMHPGER